MRCCFIRCSYKPFVKIHWHIDVIKKCISRIIISPAHIYVALLNLDGKEAD